MTTCATPHTSLALLGLLVGLLSLTACPQTRVDPAYLALVKQQHQREVRGELATMAGQLGSGDKIRIRVTHEESLSGEFVVSSDGKIQYPYIGELTVAGKSCGDVALTVGKGLQDGYLKHPNVSCDLIEFNSRRIMVLGQVKKPGSFPLVHDTTVIEAIALAGGFGERALKDEISLKRRSGGQTIRVRVPAQRIIDGEFDDVRLLPGDVISVPERSW